MTCVTDYLCYRVRHITESRNVRSTDSGFLEPRFISMELFYVPGREEQHRAVEFVPGTGATLSFPEAEGWEKESETLPELSAQFYGYLNALSPTFLS